ncbi:DUF2867 domain-containing protein [Dysgonomonas sp. 511]|uniref:DUF2867 domain-containing protein n=1 Tax=Dysgonomonas sp. 511 TaxID=2302930 RepID=UPI0013CF834E|nr:DUF2867 domain-containing protein [Dysgonomonas sp. 511]NDV79748.1 DUF2867 domain-containing protein [Dysgonomonas sp. 511]
MKVKVRKAGIPQESVAHNYLWANYRDTYMCEVARESDISPDDVMVAFWTDPPFWVRSLFRLRNSLVRVFGLKGDESLSRESLEQCIRTGEQQGFVSVSMKTADETIVLLRDKHLNAYLSVYMAAGGGSKQVSATTMVQYKNRLGRVYFSLIKPFHRLVVKSLLCRAVS